MLIFCCDEQQLEVLLSWSVVLVFVFVCSCQQVVILVVVGFVVEGKIKGNSEVLIEGEVDFGNMLVIGEGGKIVGDVVVCLVCIFGEFVGNVQVFDKVELLLMGLIYGDVLLLCVVIVEGGFCKGKIEMGFQDGKNVKLVKLVEVKKVSEVLLGGQVLLKVVKQNKQFVGVKIL